eukprot:jgi/Tetstr1/463897/TSEL_008708.t1
MLSSSLTAQTLRSYAGKLSQFAEFCHDSENISPLEATTATVVRLRKGAASAANAIGVPLSHIRYQGGWATNSDVVLDYIDRPNVLPSPDAWFFFGHIAPLRHFQVQQDSAAVAFPLEPALFFSLFCIGPLPDDTFATFGSGSPTGPKMVDAGKAAAVEGVGTTITAQ